MVAVAAVVCTFLLDFDELVAVVVAVVAAVAIGFLERDYVFLVVELAGLVVVFVGLVVAGLFRRGCFLKLEEVG